MFAKKVEELNIFRIAQELSTEIHCLVESIPYWWRIRDSDQIRRSSASVSANITEGFGQRFYHKQFIHYLNIAKGSSDETQNHLQSLANKNRIEPEKACYYLKRYKNLSVRILNFINYIRSKNNISNAQQQY